MLHHFRDRLAGLDPPELREQRLALAHEVGGPLHHALVVEAVHDRRLPGLGVLALPGRLCLKELADRQGDVDVEVTQRHEDALVGSLYHRDLAHQGRALEPVDELGPGEGDAGELDGRHQRLLELQLQRHGVPRIGNELADVKLMQLQAAEAFREHRPVDAQLAEDLRLDLRDPRLHVAALRVFGVVPALRQACLGGGEERDGLALDLPVVREPRQEPTAPVLHPFQLGSDGRLPDLLELRREARLPLLEHLGGPRLHDLALEVQDGLAALAEPPHDLLQAVVVRRHARQRAQRLLHVLLEAVASYDPSEVLETALHLRGVGHAAGARNGLAALGVPVRRRGSSRADPPVAIRPL
mmetsp:Transcript_97995/g.277774  ORF Transcript_97995/g.277774 Transcript_97995/m.277774 type:complete len:355 (-) Transcript_97995:674-1738(-)